MIKDFDQVRSQLKELADVINSFKSEAVQLKIVELVFGGVAVAPAQAEATGTIPSEPTPARSRRAKRTSKKSSPSSSSTALAKKPSRPPSKGRPGGRATLDTLVAEGFFKAPKTIGKIVEHCDTHMAMKYGQNELSGPLGRLIRDKTLTRKKNADNQYEYAKP